jgi:hypothetical protein
MGAQTIPPPDPHALLGNYKFVDSDVVGESPEYKPPEVKPVVFIMFVASDYYAAAGIFRVSLFLGEA